MKKMITLYILFVALACTSCSDWLEVQPSDRVSEEVNFSDVSGFKKALNGVYIELNRPNLYGRSLTSEVVEILAQRYAVNSSNINNYELMQFEYGSSYSKSKFSGIWANAYKLIANLNLILRNCEEHREEIAEEYYQLVKGEALALRAYLHFDLFRLFGPVYSLNSENKSIPYYLEHTFNVAPSVTGVEFMQYVIDDLLNAEKELKDSDPILTYGIQGDKRDTFLQYRNLRMNYYAVQALLARAYLYMGDNENAYTYATNLIGVHEDLFPWLNPIKLSASNVDKMFSSELIFALQHLSREESIFTPLFDGESLKITTLLAPQADVLNEIFEYDKVDYRRTSSLSKTVERGGVEYNIFDKYAGTDSVYNQLIPMLRISEMYLIAAETAVDPEERLSYLNELRTYRGIRAIDNAGNVDTSLDIEWRKELYGEGQLFFYYKRKNMSQIRSSNVPRGEVSVSSSDYVIPIPDDELKYN